MDRARKELNNLAMVWCKITTIDTQNVRRDFQASGVAQYFAWLHQMKSDYQTVIFVNENKKQNGHKQQLLIR